MQTFEILVLTEGSDPKDKNLTDKDQLFGAVAIGEEEKTKLTKQAKEFISKSDIKNLKLSVENITYEIELRNCLNKRQSLYQQMTDPILIEIQADGLLGKDTSKLEEIFIKKQKEIKREFPKPHKE